MPQNDGVGTGLAERRVTKLAEPDNYRVVLLNDDYTTKEFVVAVLVAIFQKGIPEATRIMEDVHKKGRGIVGMYSWDIAATKADQVHVLARKNEYPLRCLVEKV